VPVWLNAHLLCQWCGLVMGESSCRGFSADRSRRGEYLPSKFLPDPLAKQGKHKIILSSQDRG
jgi:hypothetical protein